MIERRKKNEEFTERTVAHPDATAVMRQLLARLPLPLGIQFEK